MFVVSLVGMQESCLNNFGNNDEAKELSIIPEFDAILKHNQHKIKFTIEIL